MDYFDIFQVSKLCIMKWVITKTWVKGDDIYLMSPQTFNYLTSNSKNSILDKWQSCTGQK